MKSDHRHELKTNELTEWMMNLPDWAQENRNTLLAVGGVIVVAILVYFGSFYRRDVVRARNQAQLTELVAQVPQVMSRVASAAMQNRDESYALVDTEKKLEEFAQKTSNPDMAALALIQRGAALRAEVHFRQTDLSHDELVAQIGKAQASYQLALDRKPKSPGLVADAKYGLGLCEEELGNFDKAAALYREVAEQKEYAGTTGQAAAAYRLQTMSDYQTAVVFEPAPPKPATPAAAPAPGQASAPTIQIQPSGASTPTVVPVTPATQGTTVTPAAPSSAPKTEAAPAPTPAPQPAAPAPAPNTPAPAPAPAPSSTGTTAPQTK